MLGLAPRSPSAAHTLLTTTPLIVQKQEYDLSSNSTTYIVDSCAKNCSSPSTLGQIEGNFSSCSMEVSPLFAQIISSAVPSETSSGNSLQSSKVILANSSTYATGQTFHPSGGNVIGNNSLFSTTTSVEFSPSSNYFGSKVGNSATTTISQILPIVTFSNFVWTDKIVLLSSISFSGSLTLNLDPTKIEEGEEIVLFEFNSSEGRFSTVNLNANSCTVSGELQYTTTQVKFRVDTITCETALVAPTCVIFFQ